MIQFSFSHTIAVPKLSSNTELVIVALSQVGALINVPFLASSGKAPLNCNKCFFCPLVLHILTATSSRFTGLSPHQNTTSSPSWNMVSTFPATLYVETIVFASAIESIVTKLTRLTNGSQRTPLTYKLSTDNTPRGL